MKKLSLAAVLLLVGCGNSDRTGPFPQPPPRATDAFYAQVLAQIAMSPDDLDAGDVDNVPATAPEDTEPELP